MKVLSLMCLSLVVTCQVHAQYFINNPADVWRANQLQDVIWKNQQEATEILTPSVSDQLFGDGVSGMATRRQYAAPQFGNMINAQNELDAIHKRNRAINWDPAPTWTPVPLPSYNNHHF